LVAGASPSREVEQSVTTHLRDEPEGLEGVTGGGGGASPNCWRGPGVETSRVWAEGASGVVSARWLSSRTSMASSLSGEASDSSSSEGGGASR